MSISQQLLEKVSQSLTGYLDWQEAENADLTAQTLQVTFLSQ